MINLKDLSEYDIKNIDIGKLTKNLQHRKDILAGFVVIFIFIFFLNKIHSEHKQKISTLRTQAAALEEKIKVISQYEKARETLKTLLLSYPSGLSSMNDIVTTLNDLATRRNIQISAFSPLGQKNFDLYTTTNIALTVSASKYEDLGAFIYDIENSKDNLRIENWSISSFSQKSDASNQKINVALEVASVNIKK